MTYFTVNKKIALLLTMLLLIWQAGFIVLSIGSLLWSWRPLFASVLGFSLLLLVFGAILEIAKKIPAFKSSRYAILSIFIFVFFYSIYNGTKPPIVKHIELATSASQLKEIKIVVIADTHIDPSKQTFTIDTVNTINKLNADVVLIVGDLCDGKIEQLKETLVYLKKLNPKYGVFFVPGNHEYYYEDFDLKMKYLSALGIKVLINNSVKIEGRNGDFYIAGISDPAAQRIGEQEPNPENTFAKTKKPVILMAHQPKTAKLCEDKKPDFVFCGHTHNGQIWPFNYLVKLVQPFVYGQYESNGSTIIVTSGAGVWGPPMRLFSQSEVLEVFFR